MHRMRNTIILVACILVLAGFLLAGTWLSARVIIAAVESVKDD